MLESSPLVKHVNSFIGSYLNNFPRNVIKRKAEVNELDKLKLMMRHGMLS